MVFLIQNTQNRDGAAIQAKLDELVRVSSGANRYIGIESLTEEELDELRERCRLRAHSATERSQEKAERAVERVHHGPLAGA
jgi:low affinity Fe/Cu permease